MCGRYFFELRELPAFARLKQKIEQQTLFEYAREEVFPSNSALVLVDGQEDYELDVMKWGIEGPYGRLINARSEGIEKKKTFRPMLSKKCLIPCNGFYEWVKVGKQKQKILIQREDAPLFYLAGIYNEQKEFVIVTGESAKEMKDIHDRTPILMLEDQIPLYLQDELEFQVDNEHLIFTAVDNRKSPVVEKRQLSPFDEEER
ncbi:SOS response-associated peptidase [[Clostridium] innocuum]|nr:SOS response-associated peptidase [Erysipelotrichaceae bacterium]MCR0383786.1 SOS response-associated peptidase [[Clostridium] innocuum]MCR0415481.1 SOS response-associated peptidase [[Clostridium] innocuum]MCR0536655.1 SOS response-associated peptidase [[Clostridium] innocuum]MCR0540726.1 SOS response-associated peptidase [[Clostridium] innocuum]